MPVDHKPLFRPDVLREHLESFLWHHRVDAQRQKLDECATLIASGCGDAHTERRLLPDFITDSFQGLLGYTPPTSGPRYSLSREQLVQVDGKYADAVLGQFNGEDKFIAAVEGKGTKEPTRPPLRRSPALRTRPVLTTPSTCRATGLSLPRCGRRGSTTRGRPA